MEIYDQHADLVALEDYTGHRVLHCLHSLITSDQRDLIRDVVWDCYQKLIRGLNPSRKVYPETVLVTAIGVGENHPRHADNRRQDRRGRWVPNHTPQRCVSAVYYLNDEFEGGEIVFEQHSISVRPRQGLLLVFPSDQWHVHEVVPVRKGLRYTMPIWWTHRRAFAL